MLPSHVLKIEMTNEGVPTTPLPGIDRVMHINPDYIVDVPGQIRAYSTDNHAEHMAPVLTSPRDLADEIRSTLREGVYAVIGNAGAELSFRHVFSNASDNIRQMIRWADEAYDLIGPRLVLAPMDFDLLFDGMLGCQLMSWAAKRSIPLAVFCAYRFLFQTNAFPHIHAVNQRSPIERSWHPYRYPFNEVFHWIRGTGVELWTGAGTQEGLQAGVIELAARFGFGGVFTFSRCWAEYLKSDIHASNIASNYLDIANARPVATRFRRSHR
jgi:hypothetical protein